MFGCNRDLNERGTRALGWMKDVQYEKGEKRKLDILGSNFFTEHVWGDQNV